MKRAKVLIVDDSMLMRRLVNDALAADAAIEVVGEAANGRIALQKIVQTKPDLVTLDIEMPEMDGLATLREIRATYPRLPVVMFSALTERGAADTLEALHNGASDYVTKPTGAAGKAAAQQRICDDLIPKIRSLCHVGAGAGAQAPSVRRERTAPISTPTPTAARPMPPDARVDVVAMALSTGGPNALAEILSALPADFAAPIVLVQHMPNVFTKFLADRLRGQTSLAVVEASEGQIVERGTVYIAPGDFHLCLQRRGAHLVTALNQDAPEHSHRPAADVLFRSVAEACGAHALALVLTGMGEDGLRGSGDIHRAGGCVLVQDEATSLVWEMPGHVVHAGLADAVLPLGEMAGELVRRAGSWRTVGATAH